MEQALDEFLSYKRRDILNEMGAGESEEKLGHHFRLPAPQTIGPAQNHSPTDLG